MNTLIAIAIVVVVFGAAAAVVLIWDSYQEWCDDRGVPPNEYD